MYYYARLIYKASVYKLFSELFLATSCLLYADTVPLICWFICVMCTQCVEEKYLKHKDVHEGPEKEIEIESAEIKLAIPTNGIMSNGWEVRPYKEPIVSFCSGQLKNLLC